MKIVGFSGKAGAGKTTAALHSIECFGGVKLSFADALKGEVAGFLQTCCAEYRPENLFGTQADKEELCSVSIVDWCQTDYRPRRVLNPYVTLSHDNITISFRSILQLWGTEYRRTQNPAYWLDKVCKSIEDLKNSAKPPNAVYIDDVRFSGEAEMIRSLGRVIIRIDRPEKSPSGATQNHSSETALDAYKHFHRTISNTGTIDEFKYAVRSIIRR